MYQGETIRVSRLDDGFVELCFDRPSASVNCMDKRMNTEFAEATRAIAGTPGVRGVLMTSAKDEFVVGADINEFGALFRLSPEEFKATNERSNAPLDAFEDLELPTVAAINGYALGAGLEVALTASYRVMSTAARVGLPEVTLGLIPGAGGTVRLPRVAGAEVAIDWVAGGKAQAADAALKAGVVDAVCAPQDLREVALGYLRKAAEGELDWRQSRDRKKQPLPLAPEQVRQVFTAAKDKLATRGATHQPAPLRAVEMMEQAAAQDRTGARALECATFLEVARTQAADSLVQMFHNDQLLKKLYRGHAGNARPVRQAAVLGAGIMGGGIAYTAALRGTPVLLKDISEKQLQLGVREAETQVARQLKSGRMTQAQATQVLDRVRPQLGYEGFDGVDLVVEAVVESLTVKHRVLSELEKQVRDDTVIASNTSSLRIDDIAAPLERPQNFVGMHFFNPVPAMPLVEVIRGSRTSDAAVSTAVACALAMGKTPVVVRDCPGFLVNRILTPYMRAFLQLLVDGADFEAIDSAMEAYGWPMGPAWLQDVIGMDTSSHVTDVISAGYPERMPPLDLDPLKMMVDHGRLGQKNGIGFYRYDTGADGKTSRTAAPDTRSLLTALQPNGCRDFGTQEIVERMMLPLIIEAVHCLEEGVVATPSELDMALLLGIGLPRYLGGALKCADWMGLSTLVQRCDMYANLGPAYRATERMRKMAAAGQTYYA